MIDANAALGKVRPVLASIRTLAIPSSDKASPEPQRIVPFITISREAGAGAWSLAQRLVEHLNKIDPGEMAWTCWDRELVEKVAADHHISKTLIEALEEAPHSWFMDFLAGMASSQSTAYPDEAHIYRRVAATIRALAQVGRVVVVGRAGVFITQDIPGGIHVRLVAPFEHRVKHMMQLQGLSHDAAIAYVREHDHNRAAFYRRYWPNRALAPEGFTLTLNAAALSEEQLVACMAPLVTTARAAAVQAQPTAAHSDATP